MSTTHLTFTGEKFGDKISAHVTLDDLVTVEGLAHFTGEEAVRLGTFLVDKGEAIIAARPKSKAERILAEVQAAKSKLVSASVSLPHWNAVESILAEDGDL